MEAANPEHHQEHEIEEREIQEAAFTLLCDSCGSRAQRG